MLGTPHLQAKRLLENGETDDATGRENGFGRWLLL